MDARLLRDPSFWTGGESFAPGAGPGETPRLDEPAGLVLFGTSGSTGEPKKIALSKDALLLSAAAVNRHLAVDGASCWGLALPWHHVGGFGVLARAYEAGCGMEHYPDRWEPVGFRAWLARAGVTHLSLVPAQVHDLVRAGTPAPSALRAVVVGGGRLDQATGRAARALGWPVLASYGMTEACSQIATQGFAALERDYQAAPMEILPIWETRLNEGGLLEISGPALFAGELRKSGGGWCFHARANRWHTTADRVSLDSGLLTPLGRADAVVKILGELVDPAAVELELQECGGGALKPGVFAVVAEADERAGHRLAAVFEKSVPAAVAAAALAAYNSQAPGFRRLPEARWTGALPRSGLGKIRRHLVTKEGGPEGGDKSRETGFQQ